MLLLFNFLHGMVRFTPPQLTGLWFRYWGCDSVIPAFISNSVVNTTEPSLLIIRQMLLELLRPKNRQKISIWAPLHNFVRLYLRNWGTYRQSEKNC